LSSAITAAVITAGAGVYSASQAGKASSRVGGQYPDYVEDENFNESQERLSGLGENILEGDVPDFFSDIGKPGGQSFEKFLNMSNADISKGILESAAATGRSGGAVQSMTAEAIGKNETSLRYKDYLNSVEGKKWLMNMGVDITSGVRTSAFGREQGINKFAIGETNYNLKRDQYLDQSDLMLGKMEGDAWGDVIGSIAGIGGMMGGGSTPSTVGASTAPGGFQNFNMSSGLGGI